MPSKDVPIIGIDLGTTTSLVSCYRNGRTVIFPNERGDLMTPSAVAFRDSRTAWVGELAINQLFTNKQNTVVAFPKRFLGSDKRFHINSRDYSPSEVSLLIVRKLRKIAAQKLGIPEQKIIRAVMGVPAHFDDNQKQATLHAGKLAGLSVIKLLSEPLAAALAYGFRNHRNEERIMVFDLGGGTLDITLIEKKKRKFRIKAIGGASSLGGMNFDEILANFLAHKFKNFCEMDFKKDPIFYQHLLWIAEKSKKDLSFVKETEILCPYILPGKGKQMRLNVRINRLQFEKLMEPLVEEIQEVVMNTFRRASMVPGWVSTLVLAGGSSRIPVVERAVRKLLRTNIRVKKDINPEEAVALGAAIFGSVLADSGGFSRLEVQDITSHHLGVEDDRGNFVTIIPQGMNYPCEESRVFTTTEDNKDEIIIHVLQARDLDKKTLFESLGYFHLNHLPLAKAGEPSIQVTFRIDKHGILNVRGRHLETGKDVGMAITGVKWLGDDVFQERRGTGLRII